MSAVFKVGGLPVFAVSRRRTVPAAIFGPHARGDGVLALGNLGPVVPPITGRQAAGLPTATVKFDFDRRGPTHAHADDIFRSFELFILRREIDPDVRRNRLTQWIGWNFKKDFGGYGGLFDHRGFG